ncbi:MAG TPA: class I SAM-dependent methyltransferase [Mycobacteriales bacterium]|nr:class I SAM-dependent methyltransferase [Mycobacteriales bacterium]
MDESRLEQFMGKAVADMAAAMTLLLMTIGDKLGIYKAMAGSGPLTSQEVARRAGLAERYVREWLGNQVASGYVEYDATTKRYTLPDEHAFALADEDSPAFLGGAFDVFGAAWAAEDKISDAFRTGNGVGWHEQHPRLFSGTERFFRPGYRANLTTAWIPAMTGVEKKLKAGAAVADVGCGHGASTIVMAEAYPQSTFTGFDYHQPSVDEAAKKAASAGVADRVRFEVASAKGYAGSYDLICFFDCLHDMGDPVGAAEHARSALKPGGSVLLVEPFANDKLEDNINPVGAMFYGASTFVCTPASLSQDVALGLGAQAGEKRLRKVFKDAGFKTFRRATETPFNLVFQAKA